MSTKVFPLPESEINAFAAKVETPFHIYDEAAIENNVRRIQRAFAWNEGFINYFAVKALPNVNIVRMLGSLLISALIIFPPLTAMRVFKTYKAVTISSAAISVVSFMAGISLSYGLGTPVGASIVSVNLLVFMFFSFARVLLKRG